MLVRHFAKGMRIEDLLRRVAAEAPRSRAAWYDGQELLYGELDKASDLLADYLQKRLPQSARCAILSDNSLEYLVWFFGILKARMAAVPLDTSLSADSLSTILTDCQAELLCAQLKFRRKLPSLLDHSHSISSVITDSPLSYSNRTVSHITLNEVVGPIGSTSADAKHNSDTIRPLTLDDLGADRVDDSLAAIFYTSGSTGAGKGVMLSHKNLVSNTIATVEYLKLTAGDSVMVILPFYYIYGNSLLLTHVAAAGTCVIDNRFLYPEVVLDTMEQQEVTGFSGVPSNFQILLGNSTFTARKLEHLRYFTQAGGAMATETIRRLMKGFPSKEIYIMYGQTEASPRVSWLPPERLAEKIGSVGIPVPGVRIIVADDSGKEVPSGETGEIVVDGDNVMIGYWNQPDENRTVLKGGMLHTGDLARRDSDGYIYIVGRKKEIIKVGGNRVSVKEVEECLLAHDKVLEATVIGVPDPLLGETVKAIVVLRPNMTADAKEFVLHCKQRLADFKVPRIISFVDSLPKYQSGKVNKLQLKQEHAGQ